MVDVSDPPATDDKNTSRWTAAARGIHDALAPKVDARKRAHLADILETVERDLAPHIAPLLADVIDNPDVPQSLRDLMRAVIEPEHFTQSLLVGIGLGSILSPVLQAATAPWVQDLANAAWQKNPSNPLSPAEVAIGVLRHNPHVGDPYATAAMSGADSGELDALIYNTGESLAVGELLLLYRRGQIDQARLVTGLRQSRVRDEWLPELLDLRFAPPGSGEVIAGVLKHHLSPGEGRQKFSEAGVNPDNFDWLLATAGRPPGVESVVQLWNRGLASEADVDRTIAQSDINPDFASLVKATRWYHVPPRSIVPMLRAGGITEARARELLTQHGVRVEDQDAFIAEAHTTRTTAERHITAMQSVAAYEEHVITRAAAHDRIVALRYVAADADLLLDLADAKIADTANRAAIRRVYVRYVDHKITAAAARSELDLLLLPANSVNALMAQWTPERQANAPVLTVSQLQGGYHRTAITLTEFVSALSARGYDPFSIRILAAEAWPPTKVPPEVLALPRN